MKMVYVISKEGKPLMPTERHGHVRQLLKQGKTKVVRKNPFTIRLAYDSTCYTQRITLGINPGRTNIGLCAVNDSGKPLFTAECATRNKEIRPLMQKRANFRNQKHRHMRRRMKRRRRAVSNGTVLASGQIQRILPSYKKPVTCKDIRNKEARFSNRKRPKGWLTPTATQLLRTHVNLVKLVGKLLPVTDICIELNKFAFMRLDDPSVSGKDFQNGSLKGFDGDVKEAVYHMQKGKCLMCRRPIAEYHHVVAKHRNGSETIKNRVGLCKACHVKASTDEIFQKALWKMNAGCYKKYDALGVLNQIIPALIRELDAIYPTVVTRGYQTKLARDIYGIKKDCHNDAYAIAISGINGPAVQLPETCYRIRQFRRHDRQACHQEMLDRKYKLDGKIVATNRHKALEQTKPSLEEYVASGGRTDCLTVEHRKPIMKDPNRIMPGSTMYYNGTSHIQMRIYQRYHWFDDGTKAYEKKTQKLLNNTGLVFVSNACP